MNTRLIAEVVGAATIAIGVFVTTSATKASAIPPATPTPQIVERVTQATPSPMTAIPSPDAPSLSACDDAMRVGQAGFSGYDDFLLAVGRERAGHPGAEHEVNELSLQIADAIANFRTASLACEAAISD